jgi:uncharacterized protein (TIGR02145 family)
MACKNYNIRIRQVDLDNAINNPDPNLDGKVFVSFTDCNGNPESIAYSIAGTYSNAFCADDSEMIVITYSFEDIEVITANSTVNADGECIAPTPTPSVTPTVSISPTPSTTPLYPCNCISFTNMSLSEEAFVSYTRCDNVSSNILALEPSDSITLCGSDPGVVDGDVVIQILGNCVGRRCIPFTPTPTPSLSITPSFSVTPSNTPSVTPSISITPSRTPSISITPTISPSKTIPPTMTPTPTISVSKTPSLTPLPSVSKTPSVTPSISITPSNGTSPSPTPSTSLPIAIPTIAGLCMNVQFGAAPSVTPSITPTRTPSITPTISVSVTPSITPSTTPSVTPSITPSITPSVTPSSTDPPPPPSLTPSNTPSISVSNTPSLTPSRTPSKTPSISRTPSVTPSVTPSITPSRTPSISITPTPSTSRPCTPCALPDVVIGAQTWTACNLDVTTYRNGDIIPQVTDLTQWENLTTGAWCYYDNNSINGCTYNKLYNWYAVTDPRGLAPVGYHVPTEAEFRTLANYLGGTNVAGGKLKSTGTTLWNSPNAGATNETGWTGLPGGGRSNGQFNSKGISGPYWTSTPDPNPNPGFTNLATYIDLYSFNQLLDFKGFSKTSGYYVRLIKDVPNPLTCNTILYKTQGNQYYLYNFSTNTSTLLNVPAAPFDSVATSLGISIAPLARTSNKLWSYTWNVNGGGLNNNSIVEYNTTSNPFTATINRYIALPQAPESTFPGGTEFYPGTGLFAISNTKLIGTVNRIGGLQLRSIASQQDVVDSPSAKYVNGVMVVEYDITSNVATWTLKVKLPPQEDPAGDLLLTSDNKLIVLTKYQNYHFLNQYNYNTGVLEFRKQISPTITTDCGLAQVNNEIYLMGYNVYKFNPTTFALTLVQSPQTQLVAASQLASCINVNLPTSSCSECLTLPLKLSTPMNYNGINIIPTYTGPVASDNFFPLSTLGMPVCEGTNVTTYPSYSAFLGNLSGDYTYSLNFSQPVNNIKISYGGTNSNPNPGELFTWNTNVGVPNISLCKGCYQTVNGNTVTGSSSGNINLGEIQQAGGGIITISAPLNYTTLTLTSPGGNQGSVFSICSGSIIPQPSNALGCVYMSSFTTGLTYLYNVNNNTSSSVTLPVDQQPNPSIQAITDTHTSTKYWRGNRWGTIKEWNTTSTPNVLALNRTITIQGFPFPFGNDQKQWNKMQAIDDNTLLVCANYTIPNTPENIYFGNWINTITLFDISSTTNIVGSAQQTPLFNVYAPAGNVDALLLTTNNKLIIIGRRGNGINPFNYNNYYLSQYSYPDGALELEVSLNNYLPSSGDGGTTYLVALFESGNGKIYAKVAAQTIGAPSITYEVNLNSPYIFTQVWSGIDQRNFYFNSSINCNTVALNPAPPPPSLSPTPTPSLTPPVSPNVGVNTIYKYLDIL